MANFVNTRLRKRDLYSKLADMKGRAEDDLRKCDEIINNKKTNYPYREFREAEHQLKLELL